MLWLARHALSLHADNCDGLTAAEHFVDDGGISHSSVRSGQIIVGSSAFC